MPGITFAQNREASIEVREELLRGVCFRDEYDLTTHVEDDVAFLGSTGFPEYPVKTVETSKAVFVLEGYLYDVTDERHHIRSAGSKLLDERLEELAEWVGNRDGDFLLVAYEKETGTASMVNDTFARLPVYYATVGDDIVLSRELKAIRDLARYCDEPLEPDRLASAQTLLFGYRLGNRTLFDSVYRVPPGSYVRIGDDVQIQRLHVHDFETEAHADRSVRENSRTLASLFEDACTNRDLDGLPNVISLSGGLDSRAVAGGYDMAGVSYTAATFETADETYDSDVRFAERIADALDADWERYTVERTEVHRRDLLETKQGMNFLAMSFLFDFLEQLRSRHGAFTYVTGDGGDKALPDLTPPREFGSRRELAEFIIEAHGIFDLDEAATISGVAPETLVQTVETRLDSYPESRYDAQYVHFLVRERGMNWLTQGEDRNRYYCWSVSPFYAPQFFGYAMNVPADQKRRNRLYAAFLEELDPRLCAIKNANYNAPVTSVRHKLKLFGVSLVTRYPTLKDSISSLLNSGTSDEPLDMISETLRRTDDVPLDHAAVRNVIRNGENYDGHELYNLCTLLATHDYTARPVVQNHPKRPVSDGSGREGGE